MVEVRLLPALDVTDPRWAGADRRALAAAAGAATRWWSSSARAPARSARRSSAGSAAAGTTSPWSSARGSPTWCSSAAEVLCAGVAELPAILAGRGLRADVVVSGLPWAALQAARPRPLHAVLAELMADDGALSQLGYAATRYAPPASRQLADIRAAFEEVHVSGPVWRNLPPALVYLARRPRRPR